MMPPDFALAPRIDACSQQIFAVDTQYVRPGLDASHVLTADGETAFVDTGVNSSVPGLLDALDRLHLAVESVRWVFLTHIHLDHAGGAGALMRALPNATAVIHPRGATHMASPGKLVAGATAVYGKQVFADLYGEILPIAKERIHVAQDGEQIALGNRSLEILHTEGHARHHYCLHYPAAEAVFCGDSFGISYRVFDSPRGAFVFPTTTPVHFDPDAAHESVDRLVATNARFALLTHYSRVDNLPALALQMHEDLDAFVAIADRRAASDDREVLMRADMLAHLERRLAAHGSRADADLRREWLEMDVRLNVQGLVHWLRFRQRAG